MRKFVVASIVLALLLVSINEASAFGRRSAWRQTRRHAASLSVASSAQAAVSETATATPVDKAEAKAAPKMDESAALSEVIRVMQGMLEREYDRIQEEIETLDEEANSISYDSD